jgi:signal transduction histidine kinase
VEIVGPQAAAQGVQITTHTGPEVPAIESDRGLVKQVLLNLLTNAIKYNRLGGTVRVGAELVDLKLRLIIADTGRGIPPDSVAHIFDRFYRVPDSDGYANGTGLGLPIAKRIAETLGGEIGFETEFGEGSTFHVELPLEMKRAAKLAL